MGGGPHTFKRTSIGNIACIRCKTLKPEQQMTTDLNSFLALAMKLQRHAYVTGAC